MGRRRLALILVALVVAFTTEAFAAKPPPPPPPPPTIVALMGSFAIVSDGTVYAFTVPSPGCTATLTSAVVYGQFFTTPPVSPIAWVQDSDNGLLATLANGDLWLMSLECCTPCSQKGTYLGNIFTVAGAAAVPADMMRLDGGPSDHTASSLASTPDRIEYQTPRSGPVEVQVFDVQGRLVWSTRSEHGSAGRYSVAWDAKDVANGVYFAKIQLPDGSVMSDRLVLSR